MVSGVTPGLQLSLGSESVYLLWQRAVWWPKARTLFVADMHLGKEATFRAAAIPIPDQTHEQLARLDALISLTQATRLVVLGDMIHARQGRCPITFDLVRQWRTNHAELQLQLVRGNHDRSSGDPPDDWQVQCLTDPTEEGPFRLQHEPRPPATGIALAGHLHPTVWLHGAARDRLKLTCFMLRDNVLVLPAFSPFVDGKAIRPTVGDRIFGICEDQVLDLTANRAGNQA